MVLADGTFDPIHWGHVRYLTAAAAFGELVVRVAPDGDVLAKGRLLFQSREERLQTIAALLVVDAVCEDERLVDAICRLQPDYLAKGIDWEGRLPQDVLEACHRYGTRILYVRTQERTSTERLQA